MRAAVKKAAMAGASIFNVYIGWRVFMDHRDLEAVADMVKKMLEIAPENMYISLETTYTRKRSGA
ncbi:hypothetical protein D1872_343140 [compost metagenome]